ncbi:Tyrosine kinase domain protein [Ceratobasidium sp. AG-Ba]|nr:Tyrosine kinase domain protein [Ceratobasidium sp. AG-Ba]
MTWAKGECFVLPSHVRCAVGCSPPPGVEDITPRVQLYRVSRYQFQAAGVGGSADIFRGIYHPKNGSTTEVAVKCFRIPTGDDKDEEYEQKTRKKLIRELDIWQALNKTPHIVELFGVLQGGPIASSCMPMVYLELTIKLFPPNVAEPSPASDMWAYGCVLLEILCRIRPYDGVLGEYAVSELIKKGKLPSDRPRGPRALLMNDSLWAILILCWREQNWRPTSRMLLERLLQMLQNGEVSASPALIDLFPLAVDGPLLPWPDSIRDYQGYVTIPEENGLITSSIRATVWIGTLSIRGRGSTERKVAIKVPRLNVPPERREPHTFSTFVPSYRRLIAWKS